MRRDREAYICTAHSDLCGVSHSARYGAARGPCSRACRHARRTPRCADSASYSAAGCTRTNFNAELSPCPRLLRLRLVYRESAVHEAQRLSGGRRHLVSEGEFEADAADQNC
ncbi:hypothetical protein [Oligoflexus tunisiensis]|uniref:hypothetical protein n=1 Tax=Oligoflexus tunisiensis TaxID=708132 RepID=UPI001C407FB0|nr:hypothetical protein [Oligoflexus tunisiensis]